PALAQNQSLYEHPSMQCQSIASRYPDRRKASLRPFLIKVTSTVLLLLCIVETSIAFANNEAERKLLYVAAPGIRDYLEYGGHGILIFDIAHGHRFVKRLPSAGLNEQGKPMNVKGICASAKTKRLYVSTIRTLMCFDLVAEKLLWEKSYEGGCDRMAL